MPVSQVSMTLEGLVCQPWHICLVDGVHARVGDPVGQWARMNGMEMLRFMDRAQEFTDTLPSRPARDAAFNDSSIRAASWAAVGPGVFPRVASRLLACDITGCTVDQVHRLANSLKPFGAPVGTVVIQGDVEDWPQVQVGLHGLLDLSKVGPSMDNPLSLDIVGDVHGCLTELRTLIIALGWFVDAAGNWSPPPGRSLVCVGDLVDRGPDSIGALRLMRDLCATGFAWCVKGNHDLILHDAKPSAPSILDNASAQERALLLEFLDDMPHQLVMDGGNLVVAHAGCPERFQGVRSPVAVQRCIFGLMVGRDVDGLPVRDDWASRYEGSALVVHGHVPVTRAEGRGEGRGQVWNVDTGCAFGGWLTALRYPEMSLMQVPSLMEPGNGPTADIFRRARDEMPEHGQCGMQAT